MTLYETAFTLDPDRLSSLQSAHIGVQQRTKARRVMADFPELTYDLVTIGEEFVSNDHLITPEDVETYAFAVDDYHNFFFGASPFEGPVAHPTLLGNQALHLRHSKYVVHAGLHAQMEFTFLQPLRVGMRVRSRGQIIDKYIRRGKKYMVTAFVTVDEDQGTELIRGQFTQMLFD
jgi:acyl dehydratase